MKIALFFHDLATLDNQIAQKKQIIVSNPLQNFSKERLQIPPESVSSFRTKESFRPQTALFSEENASFSIADLEKFFDKSTPTTQNQEHVSAKTKLKTNIQKIVQKVRKYKICQNVFQIEKHGFQPLIINLDYWPEIVHPQHLWIDKSELIFNFWKSKNTFQGSFDDFISNPENQTLINYIINPNPQKDHSELKNTIIFNEEERKKHLTFITFNKEKMASLVDDQNQFLQGELIFVIGPDRNLYTCKKVSGIYHHSSFFGYKPIIAAGTLTLDSNSRIKKITNLSGHYAPNEKNFQQALKFLQTLGIDIAGGSTRIKMPFQNSKNFQIFIWERKFSPQFSHHED